MTAMTPDKVEAALGVVSKLQFGNRKRCPVCAGFDPKGNGETDNRHAPWCNVPEALSVLTEALAENRRDAARLDYIERTFSGMTNRERYLPVQMIWGKGCNGRTLREACDKYINRDAAMKETP